MRRASPIREAIARPLPAAPAAIALVATLGAGAAYCMGYELLSGGTQEWLRALGWSAGAVLPWALAFEGVKHWETGREPLRWPRLLLVLIGTGLVSLALEAAIDRWIWGGHAAPVGLQLLRRIPAVGVVTLLLIARRTPPSSPSREPELAPALADLRYVRAADNYVELHYRGRMRMERATLSHMEQYLRGRGFVRVHRSILVHPRHVVGLEPGGRAPALVLEDGTRLPTGRRYREALRHFVP
jgi:hypothetical protein